MNQSDNPETYNSTESPTGLTLGERFKQAREAQNLTFDDICKKINLRPVLLTQLENNEFESTAIPVAFMKGYIRSYAKFLQLPESSYSDVLASLSDGHKNDLGKNTRIMKHVNNHNDHSHRVGYLSLIVILILAILTACWWWQSYCQTEQARDDLVQSYVEEAPKAQEQPLQNNTIESQNLLNNNLLQTPESQPNSAGDTLNDNIKKNKPEAEAKPNSLPLTSGAILEKAMLATETKDKSNIESNKKDSIKPSAILTINITGDCWLSVKDHKNQVLAQKSYKAGDTLNFYDNSSYSLVVGAPKNVEITYKGKAYPLAINGKVARVKLS